jgi:2-dehydro-3-deoxyphosphogluconate aldolase/(4S)-4-hydroxy-2-oxoglutarate aldolase
LTNLGSAMDQLLLRRCRVLPVITAVDVASTVQLTRALASGGMTAVEITLRTDAALDSIRAVKAELPAMLVAAGTIIRPDDLDAAMNAGADFCVSPGITESLLRASSEMGVDFMPGAATASEVMLGLDYGYQCFKLFPAVAAGGVNLLKSFGGPFPQVKFCPTGGLTPENFRDFLGLSNVVCCGGSWMVSDKLVSAGRWAEVEDLARQAMSK